MAGQPTKYRPEYDEQARKLCLLGHIDDELAEYFEVDISTIHNWKISHPSFFDSIKSGRENADADIVNSLYNRAKGYEIDEEKIVSDNGIPVIMTVKKHIVPDPVSAIFWLKNRQSKKWRDKHETEQTSTNINVSVTKEEAAEIKKALDNEI